MLRSTANTRTPTAVVIDDEADKLRLPLAAGATTHLFQTAARPEAVFTAGGDYRVEVEYSDGTRE